jgi:predicted permease
LIRTFLMPNIAWAGNPIDWRVGLFSIGIAIAAGVLAGLIPALQSRAPDLTSALRAGSRGGATRSRLRAVLIIAQAALSVVLLVGAALFIQSLRNAQGRDIGYHVDRLAFIGVGGLSRDTRLSAEGSARLLTLESRLAGIPGVERVAFSSLRPKYGMMFVSYFPEADTIAHKKPEGMWTSVSSDFFTTVGTRLVRGSAFSARKEAGAEPAVIVNQTMADALWPNEDPLGRCIRIGKPTDPCSRVIGVTQTAMLDALREKPQPHLYVPIGQGPSGGRARDVILRVDPKRMSSVLTTARALLKAEFPSYSLNVNTMAKAMEPEYRPWRLGATLFSLFGGLAALVAAIGIFSTVSYAVSQRTHEFGVRAALGADMGAILRQVLSEGVRVVAIGVALGIVLAIAAGKLVASLLFGVSPGNPAALLLAAGLILAIAAASSFFPALRAARSDPAAALRSE